MKSKKSFYGIIAAVFVASALFNILFGGYISAKLSTLPVIGNLGIINRNSPIVINNREVIRDPSNADAINAGEKAKDKLSTLVWVEKNNLTVKGTVVNWTEDGYLVASQDLFVSKELGDGDYGVITSAGDFYQVEQVYPDTYANLAIIKINAKNLSVPDLADYKNLRSGQQLLTVEKTADGKTSRLFTGSLTRTKADVSGMFLESDRLLTGHQISFAMMSGGNIIFDLEGKFLGIHTSQIGQVYSGDDIKNLVNRLLSNNLSYNHPSFGFAYRFLSPVEAKVLQTNPGLQIVAIAPNKAAAIAGLKSGDIITEFLDKKINPDTDFQGLLATVNVGQNVKMKILREGIEQEVVITPGILK